MRPADQPPPPASKPATEAPPAAPSAASPPAQPAAASQASAVLERVPRGPALFVLLLLLAALAWALLPPARPLPPLGKGQPAPAFELPTLTGEPLSLASQRGRVVLLNFWATWCAPCEAEMPAMERLYRDFAPRGFELLAVSVDAGREEVLAFRERLGLSFPILHDREKRVAARYRSARFPESFLIDGAGVLRGHYIGAVDWDRAPYRRKIEQLLAASK